MVAGGGIPTRLNAYNRNSLITSIMATESVTASDLVWGTRFAKRHADEIAFRAMAPWVRSKVRGMDVLSFPAEEWLWERAFSALFPWGKVRFFGIEQDPAVYAKMADVEGRQLYPDHRLVPVGNISFAEYVDLQSSESPKYDMIYLDWLGTWCADKYDQIVAMLQSDMLAPDSMFRFTVSMNRGKPEKWSELAEVEHSSIAIADIRGGGGDMAEWRTYGIPALVVALGNDFGRRITPVALQIYYNYSEKRTTPMGSFLFRVK